MNLDQVNDQQIHAQVQSVVHKKSKKANKTHLLQAFLVSGLTMAILTGVVFAGYLTPISDHSAVIPDSEKTTPVESPYTPQNSILTSNPNVDTKPNDSFKAQYVNCLGISDGSSLTINCPTDYGMVYKAIVEVPDDLVLQFENKVFHMRNFSILENSNYLVIMYEKQTYVTTFVAK